MDEEAITLADDELSADGFLRSTDTKPTEHALEIFRFLDKDSSNSISYDELVTVIESWIASL